MSGCWCLEDNIVIFTYRGYCTFLYYKLILEKTATIRFKHIYLSRGSTTIPTSNVRCVERSYGYLQRKLILGYHCHICWKIVGPNNCVKSQLGLPYCSTRCLTAKTRHYSPITCIERYECNERCFRRCRTGFYTTRSLVSPEDFSYYDSRCYCR